MVQLIEFEQLPESLLIEIAQWLHTSDRRTLLPVLNQRWAELLRGASGAWEYVDIDTEAEFPAHEMPDPAAIMTWFSRRPGSVRELHVTGSVPKLPASLLTAVLVTQASSLRVLNLDVAAAGFSAADLAVLVVLTGLEQLLIRLPENPAVLCWDDHAAGVMEAVPRLPALKSMFFAANDHTADAALPTVSELAVLRSPRLTVMDLEMVSSPDATLILGDLPSLVFCDLGWRGHSGHQMHLTSESFSSAPGLVQLKFWDHGLVRLAPRCFSGLSMLAELTLCNCGLTAIPAALSALQHTLRRLDLRFNNRLQIEQAGYDILLAMPVLESLDLKKESWDEAGCPDVDVTLGFTPSLWTEESVRFISIFHWEFGHKWQKVRPGAALVALSV